MRKLFENRLVIIVTTIISGIFMFSLYISTKSSLNGSDTLAKLQESVLRQQERVNALEQQTTLFSDPFIQEKIQRDERLQQKPGEVILQLPSITVPNPTPETTPKVLTPWEEWKKVLFN